MKRFYLLFLIILFFLCHNKTETIKFFGWEKNVGSHISPSTDDIFYVNSYGAISDSTDLNTEYIQLAIDECVANGGGSVRFAPGIYTTGALFLKSGVNLHLDEGVILQGSDNIEDYHMIDTRIEGIESNWTSALINIIDQNNVSITGKGKIDGNGYGFWAEYHRLRSEYIKKELGWATDYDIHRPNGILIQNSQNVSLENFHISRTGLWAIRILYSKFIELNEIQVDNIIDSNGISTRGITIDSSSDILIHNTDVRSNDYNFSLMSRRDADGLRINRPTERVVIRECTSNNGYAALICGSETSGGIRDVVVYNFKIVHADIGLLFRSTFTRGGIIENIYFNDIEISESGQTITAEINWKDPHGDHNLPKEYHYDNIPLLWKSVLEPVKEEKGIPKFRNLYFTNIDAKMNGSAINITGTPPKV